MTMTSWIDLAQHWGRLRIAGQRLETIVRKRLQQGYADLTGRNFEIALWGEQAYSTWSGHPMTLAEAYAGRRRFDFPDDRVKVMSTVHWRRPHLLAPEWHKLDAQARYVLCAIDEERQRGRLVGWIPGDEFLARPLTLWPPGLIPTRVVAPRDLRELCPEICGHRPWPAEQRSLF